MAVDPYWERLITYVNDRTLADDVQRSLLRRPCSVAASVHSWSSFLADDDREEAIPIDNEETPAVEKLIWRVLLDPADGNSPPSREVLGQICDDLVDLIAVGTRDYQPETLGERMGHSQAALAGLSMGS